jgi:hypothetical protein
MQGIEIPIGAPLGQLDKDLKSANSKLNQFAAQASKSAGALGGSVANGAKSAGFALQNLGRVAQDAPFGFIGIQNNIQPLLESFQRLKVESGSTGGALKALASSLVGGGGLLLAVSLVTSALTVLAQNPEKVAGALNYLSGVVDNATATQKKYNEALIETQAEAKLEISTLESLIGIAKNETLSRGARLEALKAVKAEYPEQLNFLTLETVGSKEAAKAIDLLSDSLLRKAKIQAAEKLLGEAFIKQLQATTKTAIEQASTFSKVVGVALGAAGIKNFVVLQDGINNQTKAFKEAGSEISTYTKILNQLRTEEAKTGNLFADPIKKDKKQDFKRDPIFTAKSSINELDLFLEKYQKSVALLNKTPLVPFPGIKERLNVVTKEFIAWNASISNIINGSLVQTFAGIGNAIGDALSTGTSLAQNLGNALLSSLGSVLGQLGQMAIATGVALLGIQTALKTLNPFVAIAAGVALLALSGVVRGQASKLGGSMGGGGGSGGNFSAPVPQASSTISTSAAGSAQDFGGGRVVFEISGTNLIGVLNRAGAKLQRFGP